MGSSPKSSPDVMIEARGLSKFYGEFAATRDVTFSVPRGQICAFLGPNGAGKSTTMKMLTGFLSRPAAGKHFWRESTSLQDRIKASESLGYLPENGPLYVEMTPESLLKYMGEVRGFQGDTLADDGLGFGQMFAVRSVAKADFQVVARFSSASRDGSRDAA